MFNLGRSRSPPHHQPRDPLQNDERPLPIGWNRAFSDNVHPGRVYYTNGRRSQWNFPNPEGELQAEATHDRRLDRLEADPEEVDPEEVDPEEVDPEEVDPEEVDPEEADRLARIEAAQRRHDRRLARRLARLGDAQAEFDRQRRNARRNARRLAAQAEAEEADRLARIEAAQAEADPEEADRLARIEAAQAEADRLTRIQLTQAGNDLLEILELITINNNFNEDDIDVLRTLTRFITMDNRLPINRSTIRMYIYDLDIMIRMLRDRNVHYNLKYLCEKIFQEMYEKLAREKQMIDNEFTSHNETDTIYINAELNRLNSIYISFSNIINNVSDPPGPDYLSVETRTALALLPDLYIDPRLESWENMSARYEDFDVDLYHTFGRSVGGSMFTTPTGNRDSYENFLSGEDEDIRFVVLARGDLRLGQRLLPLTQEQEVQLQNVLDVLERCRREINAATFF